jgi:hypothetical protein
MAPIAMSYSSYAYMSLEEQRKLRQQMEKTGEDVPSLFSLPEISESTASSIIPVVDLTPASPKVPKN